MRSVDIVKDFFRTAIWNAPNSCVPRMGPCPGLPRLLRGNERTVHRVRPSRRCSGVAAFIVALASLVVPYQAGALATSNCAAGKTMCGTRCVNLSKAPRNCGACGVVCGAGKMCKSGVCTATGGANSTTTSNTNSTCATGKTMCGTRCVNLSTAPRNCGACGVVCGTGQRCSNGVCSCASGQTVSGGCHCLSGQTVNGVCQ